MRRDRLDLSPDGLFEKNLPVAQREAKPFSKDDGENVRQIVIKFDEVGLPKPVLAHFLSEGAIKQMPRAVLSLPYEPDPSDPNDEKYRGLSNLEVMVRKMTAGATAGAHGDLKAAMYILDRIIGKPVVSSQSVTTTCSLEEFLDQVSDKESTKHVDGEVIDQDDFDDEFED